MKGFWTYLTRYPDKKYSTRLFRRTYVRERFRLKEAALGGNLTLGKEELRLVRDFWKDIKVDPKYEALYNRTHQPQKAFDPRYIPDDLHQCYIDPYYNNVIASGWFDDKNLYDIIFADLPRPGTLVRKIDGSLMDEAFRPLTAEAALARCQAVDEVVVKMPIFSQGGKGVFIVDARKNPAQLMDLLEAWRYAVVQPVIRQHAALSAIHPQSINTIRIMSLLHRGEVHILSTILRMGQGESRVDNAAQGGLVCGIGPDGCLKKTIYDGDGRVVARHPLGIETEGYRIPGVEKCWELVKATAPRLSRSTKMPSWDFAIDENGNPVFIEINLAFGELDFHQMANGPLFGDLTREVIDEVFANPTKKWIRKVF